VYVELGGEFSEEEEQKHDVPRAFEKIEEGR